MSRYISLVVKNCWRNRRRTTLTILSIAVSMCLLGVMIAMYNAFYLSAPAPEEALRLVVRNRISLTVAIPEFYGARIRQVPGVREVMISQWFGGTYKDSRDPRNFFARLAVQPEKLFRIYPEFRMPEEQRKAFVKERTACVIGRDLANKLGFHLGDRINLVGDIFPGDYEFTVRGIFDSPRPSDVMFLSRDYLEQTLPEGRRGQVGTFYILLDRPESGGSVADAVDSMFRNATAQTKTESEQAFNVGFLSMLGNVKMILLGISAAVVFTILLVSANTMAMSVRERVREVGVLKTLGFTPGIVLGLILGEACVISAAGGAIGYLVSTLLTAGIRKSPFSSFIPPIDSLQLPVAAACILAAGAIGVVSALAPALGASRTSIVNALRSED